MAAVIVAAVPTALDPPAAAPPDVAAVAAPSATITPAPAVVAGVHRGPQVSQRHRQGGGKIGAAQEKGHLARARKV